MLEEFAKTFQPHPSPRHLPLLTAYGEVWNATSTIIMSSLSKVWRSLEKSSSLMWDIPSFLSALLFLQISDVGNNKLRKVVSGLREVYLHTREFFAQKHMLRGGALVSIILNWGFTYHPSHYRFVGSTTMEIEDVWAVTLLMKVDVIKVVRSILDRDSPAH